MSDAKGIKKPAQCSTCMFYMAWTQLQDEWRGGWIQIGHCRNPAVHAGLVEPEYGCGAWQRHPSLAEQEAAQ